MWTTGGRQLTDSTDSRTPTYTDVQNNLWPKHPAYTQPKQMYNACCWYNFRWIDWWHIFKHWKWNDINKSQKLVDSVNDMNLGNGSELYVVFSCPRSANVHFKWHLKWLCHGHSVEHPEATAERGSNVQPISATLFSMEGVIALHLGKQLKCS